MEEPCNSTGDGALEPGSTSSSPSSAGGDACSCRACGPAGTDSGASGAVGLATSPHGLRPRVFYGIIVALVLIVALAAEWTYLWLNPGGPVLLPVAGEVKIDGEPLAGAAVVFQPVTEGPQACGVTSPSGQFQLVTGSRSGAIPGAYRVTISKQKITPKHPRKTSPVPENAGLPPGVTMEEMIPPEDLLIEWLIPEKYGNPEQSGLKATVEAGHSSYNFQLSSQGK